MIGLILLIITNYGHQASSNRHRYHLITTLVYHPDRFYLLSSMSQVPDNKRIRIRTNCDHSREYESSCILVKLIFTISE